MMMSVMDDLIIIGRFVVWRAHGRDNSRAISKSNSRKVMATRKNFIERGKGRGRGGEKRRGEERKGEETRVP